MRRAPLCHLASWPPLLLAALAITLTACATSPAPEIPEDALPHSLTTSATPATSAAVIPFALTPPGLNSPASSYSIPPWDLIAPAQATSAQPVSFTQVSPYGRQVAKPETPRVEMMVTRSPFGQGGMLVSRQRSDQKTPMTATLSQASDGAVTLQRITINQDVTLESLPDQPLIWLPADLESLRNGRTPMVQRATATLTRDGQITQNPVVIRIRAIGNSLLPIRPAPPDVVGIEWDLTIDAAASIRVRIETWYRPGQGVLFDARTITAKLGPLNLFDKREAWIQTEFLPRP